VPYTTAWADGASLPEAATSKGFVSCHVAAAVYTHSERGEALERKSQEASIDMMMY
jgi:hypothetical protein